MGGPSGTKRPGGGGAGMLRPSCCLQSSSLGMQGRLPSLWSDGSAGVVRNNLSGVGEKF